MSKLIKRINSGWRRISGDDLASLWAGKPSKRYAKKQPAHPASILDAMSRDVKNVGRDMYSALDKLNV